MPQVLAILMIFFSDGDNCKQSYQKNKNGAKIATMNNPNALCDIPTDIFHKFDIFSLHVSISKNRHVPRVLSEFERALVITR